MRARALLGVVLTGTFLWLALRSVDLAAVGEALRSANYWLLLPAAVCTFAGFCLRAVRWARILAPSREIPFGRLFPVLMVGFAVNNLLPGRVGELARAYLTGTREGVSRSLALATIVVERVCDGLTLIAFMTITLLLFPLPIDNPRLELVVYGATAVFAFATLTLLGMLVIPDVFLRPVSMLSRRLPQEPGARLDRLASSFLEGLTALRSPRTIGEIAGQSLAIWLLECASYALILRAFPLELSPAEWIAAAAILLVFVNLGIMLPSAPGYIGTYQFFATLALGAFHVGSSYAFGLSIVAHAMQFGIITGVGLLSLWRLGFSPGGLTRLAPAPAVARSTRADGATD
jgi:uncharacterized protein (TIRG00374 family)